MADFALNVIHLKQLGEFVFDPNCMRIRTLELFDKILRVRIFNEYVKRLLCTTIGYETDKTLYRSY
jgi:hypothetical protein